MKPRWFERHLLPREPELLDTGPSGDGTDAPREVLGAGEEAGRTEVWATSRDIVDRERDRWRLTFEERAASAEVPGSAGR